MPRLKPPTGIVTRCPLASTRTTECSAELQISHPPSTQRGECGCDNPQTIVSPVATSKSIPAPFPRVGCQPRNVENRPNAVATSRPSFNAREFTCHASIGAPTPQYGASVPPG